MIVFAYICLILVILASGLVAVAWATKPAGTHRHGSPAPVPAVAGPPSAPGRLQMLPEPQGPQDWWSTPAAAAAALDALRKPAAVTFTPADPGDTCTDLAPVKAAPEYLAAPR